MIITPAIPIICYLACHGASSDHFATFIQNTQSESVEIRVYSAHDMAKKFEDKQIPVYGKFQLDDDAQILAKECSVVSVVITDVGHKYAATLQAALSVHAPKARRMAYYDNPETFVPGGYSETAKLVMQAAQEVLFANANLATDTLYSSPGVAIDLSKQKKIGLGYYPLAQAQAVAKQKQSRQSEERLKLLESFGMKDSGQNITVYFGGNNEEYFEKAFPAFLSLLEGAAKAIDLSSHLFILQQHPAAKKTNRDANQVSRLEHVKMHVSNVDSDIAQIVADRAMYYQTSMGPQFVIAGIPTTQIGHERYEDVLVRGKLIESITTVDELKTYLCTPASQNTPPETLLSALGINPEWPQVLQSLYITK